MRNRFVVSVLALVMVLSLLPSRVYGRDALEVVYCLEDPKSYTRPWVSTVKSFKRQSGVELREEFCAPVEEKSFNERVRDPAGGRTTK